MSKTSRLKLIDFIFEAAALKRIKRTGWQILGGGNKESVAEHAFMVCVISFVLSLEVKVKTEKVLLMALFHDFDEVRTGDVYKLADLYINVDNKKAKNDAFANLPVSEEIISHLKEYDQRKTLEAKLVHDADKLALCVELKQLVENGNINAHEWLTANLQSLNLPHSRKLGEEIKVTNSQDFWKDKRKILHSRMLKKI